MIEMQKEDFVEILRRYVERMLEPIVSHPDFLRVTATSTDRGLIVLSVDAHSEDIGQVIGKEGRTIASITTLARIAALRRGKQVLINVER